MQARRKEAETNAAARRERLISLLAVGALRACSAPPDAQPMPECVGVEARSKSAKKTSSVAYGQK